MSIIPRSKHGNCSNPDCGARNTACVKVGKELFCVNCRNKQKANRQIQKSQLRDVERGLLDESLLNLIHDLDDDFSKYIRHLYADENGIVQCYTCPAKRPITQMQCGHFISRSEMATRWEVKNCKPQCKTCNEYKDGRLDVFEKNLELEQKGIVDILRQMSNEVVKFSRSEIKEMIIDYRHKLNLIKKPT